MLWTKVCLNNCIYISDGSNLYKIGKESKFYHKMADREVKRRNLNPKAEGFEFSKKDIYKLINVGARINFRTTSEEERYDIASYTLVRCIKHYKLNPKASFMHYYFRAVYNAHANRRKERLVTNVRIDDDLIESAVYHSLDRDCVDSKVIVDFKFLTPRELDIITKRYMNGLTLKEVGDELGMTRERIRQIEGNALNRIRRSMGEKEILHTTELRRESERANEDRKDNLDIRDTTELLTPATLPPRRMQSTPSKSSIVKAFIRGFLASVGSVEQVDFDLAFKKSMLDSVSFSTFYKVRQDLLDDGVLVMRKRKEVNCSKTRLVTRRYWSLNK